MRATNCVLRRNCVREPISKQTWKLSILYYCYTFKIFPEKTVLLENVLIYNVRIDSTIFYTYFIDPFEQDVCPARAY